MRHCEWFVVRGHNGAFSYFCIRLFLHRGFRRLLAIEIAETSIVVAVGGEHLFLHVVESVAHKPDSIHRLDRLRGSFGDSTA